MLVIMVQTVPWNVFVRMVVVVTEWLDVVNVLMDSMGRNVNLVSVKTMEWYHNLAVVVKYMFGKIIILNKLNKEILVID